MVTVCVLREEIQQPPELLSSRKQIAQRTSRSKLVKPFCIKNSSSPRNLISQHSWSVDCSFEGEETQELFRTGFQFTFASKKRKFKTRPVDSIQLILDS